jgi:hypothetical protein
MPTQVGIGPAVQGASLHQKGNGILVPTKS